MASGGRECSGPWPVIQKDDMASGVILSDRIAALHRLPGVDELEIAEESSSTRAPRWPAAMVRLGSCSGVAAGCPLGAALAGGKLADGLRAGISPRPALPCRETPPGISPWCCEL
jgi:hypothetical protein